MAGYRIHDRRFKSIYLEMVRALEVGDTVEQLYFFDRVRFPRSWMGVTEKRLATDMDDLRLAIASRLYKMETDTYPSATTDLVPQYLPEEVVDRETGESYTWDESGKWSAP